MASRMGRGRRRPKGRKALVARLMAEMGWDDPKLAQAALEITLRCLKDVLLPVEAVRFASLFPRPLKKALEAAVSRPPPRGHELSLREFFGRLDGSLAERHLDAPPGKLARSVAQSLGSILTEGDLEFLRRSFPPEFEGIWPAQEPPDPHLR